MPSFTEDHLVEQPAIQFMQYELGWDVVNCYDEWNGGVSNQGRDGKREGVEILNVGFWILNERGRRQAVARLNPALSLAEGLICWPVKFLDHYREPAS
jgi:hypothetical protein